MFHRALVNVLLVLSCMIWAPAFLAMAWYVSNMPTGQWLV